jgi:protein phosphatase
MSLFRRLFNSSEEEEIGAPPAEQTAEPDIMMEETQPKMPSIEMPTTPVVPPALDGATRQLPAEKVISVSNARLTFGQTSDVGMVRANNEDAGLSFFSTSHSVDDFPDFGVFIIADGMGGHNDGEKASAITVRVVADEITNSIFLPILAGNGMADLPPISEVLAAAVQKANSEVFNSIPKGGGTTCTAVVVLGDRAYIAHVGDSRAYLITKEGIEKITRDHSMVERLIELGQLTPEEAENHPRGHELYRALGFKDMVEVDSLSRRLPPNSKLVLCSDGLWGNVKPDEIVNIVNSYPNPQEACNKLVALANTRGGPDNITVIVLRTG